MTGILEYLFERRKARIIMKWFLLVVILLITFYDAFKWIFEWSPSGIHRPVTFIIAGILTIFLIDFWRGKI